MMNEKILVFDMDGTIADFYGVNGWLDYLKESNPTPYIIAKPLYDMVFLTSVLNILKAKGWKIVITSWLAKDSTKDFDKEVRQAKRDWLEEYNFPFDEIHLVKYGTTKANCTRKLGGYQILVDDNEQVRKGWNLGATINANENILDKLIDLLVAEF
jgi:phosphoglycolate phosphatase-like HAD superfamily hydrolase